MLEGNVSPRCASAALRVCSIICSSCLWRRALCEQEQKEDFFFLNNGFLFKKTVVFELKTVLGNFLELYGRWKGLWAPDTRTHLQTAPICAMQLLFLLLAVRFGLQMPLEGPRGPNEPEIVFLGTSPKWYDRGLSLIGSLQRSHNIRRGVPPTLHQV